MKKLTTILSVILLSVIGSAIAKEGRPELKIDPSHPIFVTPMERDTVRGVVRFLKGKGSPLPLEFKVPAESRPLVYCEFSPLTQINNGMRCVELGATAVCPKEVVVRLPSGDTIVKEIECNGPPTQNASGQYECECDFKK